MDADTATDELDYTDCIEACRTCGVFYLTTSNLLRQIFTAAMDDPEMNLIRLELQAWNVEVNENDELPQYICTGCILDFQRVFKFRRSCIEMQQQLRHFYNLRQTHATLGLIQIKTEQPDPDEGDCAEFIYVDDLSDGEYDGATPFTIPHVPIKEERIEEAIVPPAMKADTAAAVLESTTCQSVDMPAAMQKQQEPTMFIYVDDFSCGVYDGATSFTIANAPIKEERIEEAIVPPPPSPPLMEVKAEAALESTTSPSEDMLAVALQEQAMPSPPPLTEPQPEEEEHAEPEFSAEDVECASPLAATPETSTTALQRSIHADIRDFECRVCGKEFKNSTATRLKFHLKWHKIRKHIKCVQCAFFCNSRAAMREHMRAEHASSECPMCSKLVLAKRMKSHMRGHQHTAAAGSGGEEQRAELSVEELPCNFCSESFSNESAREQHTRQFHATCEILCSHCGQKFTQHSELQRHWNEAHHITATPNDPNEPPSAATTAATIAEHDFESKSEAAADSAEQQRLNIFETPTDSMQEDDVNSDTNANERPALALLQNSALNCSEEERTETTFPANNTSASQQDNVTSPEKDNDDELNENDEQIDENDDDDDAVLNSSSSEMETGSMSSASIPPPQQQMLSFAATAAAVSDDEMHRYICAQCTQTFASIAALCAHHETHLQKLKFSCHICGKSFALKFSLNRHLKKHKKAPF